MLPLDTVIAREGERASIGKKSVWEGVVVSTKELKKTVTETQSLPSLAEKML